MSNAKVLNRNNTGKTDKKWKRPMEDRLIEKMNPTWKDLYVELTKWNSSEVLRQKCPACRSCESRNPKSRLPDDNGCVHRKVYSRMVNQRQRHLYAIQIIVSENVSLLDPRSGRGDSEGMWLDSQEGLFRNIQRNGTFTQ